MKPLCLRVCCGPSCPCFTEVAGLRCFQCMLVRVCSNRKHTEAGSQWKIMSIILVLHFGQFYAIYWWKCFFSREGKQKIPDRTLSLNGVYEEPWKWNSSIQDNSSTSPMVGCFKALFIILTFKFHISIWMLCSFWVLFFAVLLIAD